MSLNPSKFACTMQVPHLLSENETEVKLACESLATVVLQNLDDVQLGLSCLEPMGDLLDDSLKGPWIAQTSGQDAIVAFATRHADNRDVMNQVVFLIGGGYGVPPAVTTKTSQLGGFTVLFNTIESFPSDLDLQMQTYRALSDPSYTPAGAQAIANEGGPYEGIKFMVEQMKTHPNGHQAVGKTDNLDLLYEIMQVSAGLLTVNSTEYAPVFMKEGFADQIIHAMTVESDLRATQDVACKCMSNLAMSPSFAAEFMNKGAVRLMKEAIETFLEYDPTPFCAGHTLGNEYPVVPFCVDTLQAMATVDPSKAEELMIEAGLEGTLTSLRPNMLNGETLLGGSQAGVQLQDEVTQLLDLIRS